MYNLIYWKVSSDKRVCINKLFPTYLMREIVEFTYCIFVSDETKQIKIKSIKTFNINIENVTQTVLQMGCGGRGKEYFKYTPWYDNRELILLLNNNSCKSQNTNPPSLCVCVSPKQQHTPFSYHPFFPLLSLYYKLQVI